MSSPPRERYGNDDVRLIGRVRSQKAITPSDSEDLVDPRGGNAPTRAIKLDVAGTVNVLLEDDTTPVASDYAALIWHPMAAKRIYSSGTDSNLGIVGGW